MALVIAVQKRLGEAARLQLQAQNALDHSRRIASDEKFVYLPITGKIRISTPFKIVQKRLPPAKRVSLSWEELLQRSGAFSEKQVSKLALGLDIIGDIAVLDLPRGLSRKQKLAISRAVRTFHPNVKVIAAKKGALKGTFRLRKLDYLWGEKRASTVHTEAGVRMKVDLEKAYFSPRLSFDRAQVAKQARPGERVLVLFAGVGPYALVVAKSEPRVSVIANELNPHAVSLLRENIALNHLQDVIVVHAGDAAEAIRKHAAWATRVLMPAPWEAERFLPAVLKQARRGAIVHYRSFVRLPRKGGVREALETVHSKVDSLARRLGKSVEILDDRVVMRYSPGIVQTALDFKIL